jgi:hypothetical protein
MLIILQSNIKAKAVPILECIEIAKISFKMIKKRIKNDNKILFYEPKIIQTVEISRLQSKYK